MLANCAWGAARVAVKDVAFYEAMATTGRDSCEGLVSGEEAGRRGMGVGHSMSLPTDTRTRIYAVISLVQIMSYNVERPAS